MHDRGHGRKHIRNRRIRLLARAVPVATAATALLFGLGACSDAGRPLAEIHQSGQLHNAPVVNAALCHTCHAEDKYARATASF
ncbi:MAG: hypothetical protein LBD25_08920, partial [Coriobacteriales bacterium]|nr:hypothetical protein [Coriobacteriales bacterium]